MQDRKGREKKKGAFRPTNAGKIDCPEFSGALLEMVRGEGGKGRGGRGRSDFFPLSFKKKGKKEKKKVLVPDIPIWTQISMP